MFENCIHESCAELYFSSYAPNSSVENQSFFLPSAYKTNIEIINAYIE